MQLIGTSDVPAPMRLQAVPGGNTKAPGVDVILDLVGASHFPKNIEALSIEGRLLLVGLPSGMKAEINLAQVRCCLLCCSELQHMVHSKLYCQFLGGR